MIEKSSSNLSSHQTIVSLTLERQEDKQHQMTPHLATLSSSKLLTTSIGSAVVVDQSDALTTLCRLRNRFPLARCSDDDSSQVCKKVWFNLGFSYGPPYICKYFERYSYFSGMIYHLKRTIRYYCGSACPAWWIARLGVSGVFNSAVPRYQLDIFFLSILYVLALFDNSLK